jgi:hypothetical protein
MAGYCIFLAFTGLSEMVCLNHQFSKLCADVANLGVASSRQDATRTTYNLLGRQPASSTKIDSSLHEAQRSDRVLPVSSCRAAPRPILPSNVFLNEGMKPMTPPGPECADVDQFLKASRHAERWLSHIETIAVFCKEGLSDYARDGIMGLRNEHGQFVAVLHAWRETLTSVAAEKVRIAAHWFPSAHAATVGMTARFILGLDSTFRLSEIMRGNGAVVNGDLDYSCFGKNGSWPEIRDFVITFRDNHFRDDDLSRITAPLELERAVINCSWQPNWSGFFTRDRWLQFFEKAGWPISKDTFKRRTKAGGGYRKSPQSERGRISLDLNALPAAVRAIAQKA